MELEKKVLYSNTYCAYRDKYMGRTICRHKYSYGVCDLDICPIVHERYANVIFQPNGLVLVVKRPSDQYVAGAWEIFEIEISPELDNEEEVISFCLEKANGVPEKIKAALVERIRRIFRRWRFLRDRGKPIGILERERRPEEVLVPVEEELLRELERIEAEEEGEEAEGSKEGGGHSDSSLGDESSEQ